MSSDEKEDADKALIKRIGKSDNFLVIKKGTVINKDYVSKFYDNIDSFDIMISCMKTLNVVSLNRERWTESCCTCSFNQKYYFCYHVIALTVNKNLTEIDNIHKKRAIGQKQKSGKKGQS
jgi:hypothetical protein